MDIIITKEELRRNPGYAVGKLLGQKNRGSGDTANEFPILYKANEDGTYTMTVPGGRATKTQIEALLDDPEQPPVVLSRIEELAEKITNDTDTDAEFREYIKLRDGLV